MMNRYIAKDGDRIDCIVYRRYGTLEPLEVVISLNAHLEAILSAGDTVLLPEWSATPKRAKLW